MRARTIDSTRNFFLVFETGDEVIAVLRRFAQENKIEGGWFHAVGALECATIAWWSWVAKEYENRQVEEQLEVLSLAGTIGLEGGKSRIHAHVSLGRRDGIAVGGHLVSGVVRPTLEMVVVDFRATLQRSRDQQTGLALIRI